MCERGTLSPSRSEVRPSARAPSGIRLRAHCRLPPNGETSNKKWMDDNDKIGSRGLRKGRGKVSHEKKVHGRRKIAFAFIAGTPLRPRRQDSRGMRPGIRRRRTRLAGPFLGRGRLYGRVRFRHIGARLARFGGRAAVHKPEQGPDILGCRGEWQPRLFPEDSFGVHARKLHIRRARYIWSAECSSLLWDRSMHRDERRGAVRVLYHEIWSKQEHGIVRQRRRYSLQFGVLHHWIFSRRDARRARSLARPGTEHFWLCRGIGGAAVRERLVHRRVGHSRQIRAIVRQRNARPRLLRLRGGAVWMFGDRLCRAVRSARRVARSDAVAGRLRGRLWHRIFLGDDLLPRRPDPSGKYHFLRGRDADRLVHRQHLALGTVCRASPASFCTGQCDSVRNVRVR